MADIQPAQGSRLRSTLSWLWLTAALCLALQVHAPVFALGFVGDDYQWWLHARQAIEDPWLLPAAYGGYRPANTWSLALDHLLWGTDAVGYHATSMLLHLACGLALWVFLRRFEVAAPARAAVVALWLVSPYTRESVHGIVNRFQLMLLLCWLGLAILWPGPGKRWSLARGGLAVAIGVLTIFVKESWVVLPGFVVSFELFLARRPLGRALALGLAVALGPLCYVLVYFSKPAIETGSFYGAGLNGALKVPHAWAAFMQLTQLIPLNFPLGAMEILGLAFAGLAVWLGVKRRSHLMGVGFTFFLLPFLPVLPVGWISTRYTTIPLVGFLCVALAAARELPWRGSASARWTLSGLAAALVTLLLAAETTLLRADLRDAARFAAVHESLLAEGRAFLLPVPAGRAIVALRLEQQNPLPELVASTEGILKLYYARPRDPYALIDWPALLSYLLDPQGGPLYEAIPASSAEPGPFAVVAHVSGGFVWLPPETADAASELALWQGRDVNVRLLRPWLPRQRTWRGEAIP